MKLESFIGVPGPVITIQRPTDLYPALDHIQSCMMEHVNNGHKNAAEFERCANLLSEFMQKAEEAGFGNMDDVDNIEW